jgi:hypothetical protein
VRHSGSRKERGPRKQHLPPGWRNYLFAHIPLLVDSVRLIPQRAPLIGAIIAVHRDRCAATPVTEYTQSSSTDLSPFCSFAIFMPAILSQRRRARPIASCHMEGLEFPNEFIEEKRGAGPVSFLFSGSVIAEVAGNPRIGRSGKAVRREVAMDMGT